MKRRNRRLIIALFLVAVWLLAPEMAYADNCSSLNDCYYTLRAALAAAVGLGVFAALMAIGLDIGPLASRLRKRSDGDGGPESIAGDGDDEWDRSLGVVSVEGLLSEGVAQAAPAMKSAPPRQAPDQAAMPDESLAKREAPRGAPDRTADQLRDAAPEGFEGRQAPETSPSQTPAGEGVAGDSGVADRAHDATHLAGEAGEPGPMGEQAQPPGPNTAPGADQTSTQGEAPPSAAADEGPRAVEQAHQAKRAPDQAGASQQSQPLAEAPSADASTVEAGMEQAAPESDVAAEAQHMEQAAPRDDRLADHARSDAQVTSSGRRAGEAGEVAASTAGDTGESGVAERAQDVASAFEPAPGEGVAHAGEQGEPPESGRMAQGERPDDLPGEQRVAHAGAQSEEPSSAPRQAGRQAAKPAAGEVASEPSVQSGPDLRSEQEGAPATSGGQATAPPEVSESGKLALARDLAQTYRDLSRIPGMRLLLQQVAYHGAWAARGAAAQLSLCRQLGQQGRQVARLEDEERGADIVTDQGPVIEVKDYYWPGPFFQDEENVAAATRRLVRQAEILRRRYADREVHLAFSDARHVPRQMHLVLQSVGVDVIPHDAMSSSGPEAVAGVSFVDSLKSTTPQHYWDALLACGWQNTTGTLQARLYEAFDHDPASAWLALASCSFDAESIYETAPLGESYNALLQEMSRASAGAFRPERVAEQIRGDAHLLAFTHDGRRYGLKTPAASDYFSHAVLDRVNRALNESGDRRRFWPLPAPDQLLHLVFEDLQVVRQAVAAGLIPQSPRT